MNSIAKRLAFEGRTKSTYRPKSVMSVGFVHVAKTQLRKGRRPSFDRAAAPRVAAPLVDGLIERLQALGVQTASGRFGEQMALELVNDGPVTLVMEVSERRS